MANGFQDNAGGGISFAAPIFSFGNTNAQINSGFNFDLPMSTIQSFANNALSFTQNNAQNNQAFLAGVISQQQGAVSGTANRAFDYQTRALDSLDFMTDRMEERLRYATKQAGKRGCFITTAVCESSGLPDNCDELQTLRAFRDRYMMADEGMRGDLETYYEIAPDIVARISVRRDAAKVFALLREAYIAPAVALIKSGDYAGAYSLYVELVQTAQVFSDEGP